jgi:hypothetical protein
VFELRVARVAVTATYWLGCFVVIVSVGAAVSGWSATGTALGLATGLALGAGAVVSDRRRRREFHPPLNEPSAITDPRTVRQLRVQLLLAATGGLAAVILMHIGAREVAAGRAEIAEFRTTGVATVGTVVGQQGKRWWVRNDQNKVTVSYRRAGDDTEVQVKYSVAFLDDYPIGREVEVIYDPASDDAVVDDLGFGVGEGPAGFLGLFGGLGTAAAAAYQLNSIRRIRRIVSSYPWVNERVVTSEREPVKLGFTRMYVSVIEPGEQYRVLLRLAYGQRFRRRTIHDGTTLRLAGDPLDDIVIDIPRSRLLVPAGPISFAATDQGEARVTQVNLPVLSRRQRRRRRAAR